MKGWRTIAVGLAVAIAPAALQYLGGIHWESYVSPSIATLIAGALTVGMRVITTTPVGSSGGTSSGS